MQKLTSPQMILHHVSTGLSIIGSGIMLWGAGRLLDMLLALTGVSLA
jgi:hypothetical protein